MKFLVVCCLVAYCFVPCTAHDISSNEELCKPHAFRIDDIITCSYYGASHSEPVKPFGGGQCCQCPKKVPLNLYEISNIKLIWADIILGANEQCSFWRAETQDYPVYPVGDIVVPSYDKPSTAYVVGLTDPNDSDSLKLPVSYTEIWNDNDSSLWRDVAIWNVNCLEGYLALSNVATNGSYPSNDSIYCVKSQYVLPGNDTNWIKVWTNSGSILDNPVLVYEAVASTEKQQAVRGFGAIALLEYDDDVYPGTPYLLNKDYINIAPR